MVSNLPGQPHEWEMVGGIPSHLRIPVMAPALGLLPLTNRQVVPNLQVFDPTSCDLANQAVAWPFQQCTCPWQLPG